MSLALDPETQLVVDPRDAAESAGLRYVSDDEPVYGAAKQERDFPIKSRTANQCATKPRASGFAS
jgi:hypothetical protein